MATLQLHPHPNFPPRAKLVVKAGPGARRARGHMPLCYQVYGDIDQIRWPDAALEGRVDRLWEHSCFEVFLAVEGAGPGYLEMNFAPGRQWAAYAFDSYRAGMADDLCVDIARMDWVVRPQLSVPRVEMHVLAMLPDRFESADIAMGLSLVIEELGGTKSYWALAHAPGSPDFHNRDCFTARLPAPEAA
ncbi:MAG: DOMON-like domain-containing protein [Sphingomonas sp.]